MSDVAGMEGLPVSSAITEWRATDAQRRFSISSNETLNVASRWREFLCEVYYPMDAYRIDKSHFHGKLDEIQLDFLQITTFEADRQQVERTRFHTKFDQSEQFVFLIPRRGVMRWEQFGRDSTMSKFTSTMVLCTEPYRASCEDDFANVTVKIPADLIRRRIKNSESLCGAAHRQSAHVNATIWNMVAGFFDGSLPPPPTGDPFGRRLAEMILDLVVFALDREQGKDEPADGSHREMMRNRIVEYLRSHLCDPTLSPQAVASANGISVSYMNKLLHASGQSVSQRLLDERLALCRDRLLQANLRHLSIGRIAFDAGFNNHAYFTSRFRAKYGMTPRDARRVSLQSDPVGATEEAVKPAAI